MWFGAAPFGKRRPDTPHSGVPVQASGAQVCDESGAECAGRQGEYDAATEGAVVPQSVS